MGGTCSDYKIQPDSPVDSTARAQAVDDRLGRAQEERRRALGGNKEQLALQHSSGLSRGYWGSSTSRSYASGSPAALPSRVQGATDLGAVSSSSTWETWTRSLVCATAASVEVAGGQIGSRELVGFMSRSSSRGYSG
jgi:hypothetical protein